MKTEAGAEIFDIIVSKQSTGDISQLFSETYAIIEMNLSINAAMKAAKECKRRLSNNNVYIVTSIAGQHFIIATF